MKSDEKSEQILTLPSETGLCRDCGVSDIDTDHFVEFRIVRQGNRGKIVCTTCGQVAWDVRGRRPFENLPGDELDKLLEAIRAFEGL
jgi:hypothetical protein